MTDAKIDFDAAGGVDLNRLERSLELYGERVADGRYRVTGGRHEHWVDLYTASHPRDDRRERRGRRGDVRARDGRLHEPVRATRRLCHLDPHAR